MRQRTQASGHRVERRPLALDKEKRSAVEPPPQRAEALTELALVRDDQASGCRRRGGPGVGSEIAERRVLLVADGRDHGHGAARHGADESLVAERQQVLEAASAAGEDDDVDAGLPDDVPERSRESRSGARSLHVCLRDDDLRRGEASRDGGDEVALRRGLVAGHQSDPAGEKRQRPLARRREEPFAGESALELVDSRQESSEPQRLDRQRAEAKLAAGGEELRPAENVNRRAVHELEAERVEAAPRHADGKTGAVPGILQGEEDALPAVLAPKLRDLAFDPDGRKSREPRSNAAIERGDGVELGIPVELVLDLHTVESSSAHVQGESRSRAETLEEDLRRDVGRAAAMTDQLHGFVKIGFALSDPLRERKRVAGLHEDVKAPTFDFPALVLFPLEDRQLFHPA